MASGKKYRRLPGKHRRTFSQDTLWTGPDHLLWVSTGFYQEEYRRFYYKDIQCIVSRKTDRGKLINLVFGLLSAAPVPAIVYFSLEFPPLAFVLGSVAAIFIVLLLGNLILGPTCETHLRTEVQTQRLYSLKRTRSARKAMETIASLIEKAQAGLESSGKVRTASALEPTPDSASNNYGPDKMGKRHETGAWHFALYLSLALSGLLTAVDFFYPREIVLFGILSGFAISGILCVVALVKQTRSDLPAALSKLTWFALAFLCLCLAAVEIGRFSLSLISFPYDANNFWTFLEKASDISPSDAPVAAAVLFYFISGGLVLGIIGLFILATRSSAEKKEAGDARAL